MMVASWRYLTNKILWTLLKLLISSIDCGEADLLLKSLVQASTTMSKSVLARRLTKLRVRCKVPSKLSPLSVSLIDSMLPKHSFYLGSLYVRGSHQQHRFFATSFLLQAHDLRPIVGGFMGPVRMTSARPGCSLLIGLRSTTLPTTVGDTHCGVDTFRKSFLSSATFLEEAVF